MGKILELIKSRALVIDGAMGTMLQEGGMEAGACPEGLNLTTPGLVREIHGRYAAAGADVITTNTFGGTRIKLAEYGLAERVAEINRAGVVIAKEAASKVGREVFVAGGIGPTGRFLAPVGDMTFDEAYGYYFEQAAALADAGADLILIETMSDIKEARAALIAAKAATKLPVVITMTFQADMRTLLGTPPGVAVAVLQAAGADLIGANCSLGPEGLYEVAKAMAVYARVPLAFQPNAGLPRLEGGRTVYPASPEDLAGYAEKFLGLGAGLVGSCCGSTPEHTRAIAERVMKQPSPPTPLPGAGEGRSHSERSEESAFPSPHRGRGIKGEGDSPSRLASRTRLISIGQGAMPVIIGERINPTGRKDLSAELTEGKFSLVKKDARGQAEAGASLIDVNVGLPGGDEAALMPRVIRAVEESSDLPVVIDSTDPAAIEAALKEVSGKALVNSVTGDRERLASVLPLVKKYGAAVIGLTIDEEGVPATAEKRVEIAGRILAACEAQGIPKEDLVIDALVLTASAEQAQAIETLKAVSMIRERLGLATSLGVSNVSFGLPDRPLINASFLTMALGYGLDAAMVNPYDKKITEAMSAGAVLTGRDKRAERYIKKRSAFAKLSTTPPNIKAKLGAPGDLLKQAIIEGDKDGIVPLVEAALKAGMAPMDISNNVLIPALTEVGRLYETKEFFLPQVMQSGETMKAAFARLKLEMKPGAGGEAGTIVLATVFGDVHDIGKNIVATLLENHGFRVIDLGKNVPKETILDAAVKNNADIIGLSALMTTTMTQMEAVIKERDRRGLKIPVVLGGAVVTEDYAKKVGAAGSSRDALEAVRLIKGLVRK